MFTNTNHMLSPEQWVAQVYPHDPLTAEELAYQAQNPGWIPDRVKPVMPQNPNN